MSLPNWDKRRMWQGVRVAEEELRTQEEEEQAEFEAMQAVRIAEGLPPLPATVFEPTEEQRALARQMAAAGFTIPQIQLMIRRPNGRPVVYNTLMAALGRDIIEAKIQADLQIRGATFKSALAGNVAAQKLWEERMSVNPVVTQRVEVTGKDGEPLQQASGVLMVPATPDQWEELVRQQQEQLAKDTAQKLHGDDGAT